MNGLMQIFNARGSPPLARVPPQWSSGNRQEHRITPARAGTTSKYLKSSVLSRDHPRSRGYHYSVRPRNRPLLGSPPLARVPLRNTRSIRPPCRITPARAGTTSSVHPPVQSAQDHPRSRGYHISRFEAVQGSQGSPPLARVPQPFRSLFFFKIRITPARAGTTCSCHRCLQEVWDHPRSRGYHVDHQHESGILVGSPPLARVPQPRAPIAQMSPRITPARAGTTEISGGVNGYTWDHPRSRGYHSFRRARIG